MDSTDAAREARTPAQRTQVALAAQQLAAIEQFLTTRRRAEAIAEDGSLSREQRLDHSRRQEVLQRQHEALIARSHEQLRSAGDPMSSLAQRRLVIAHRNGWFAGKVTEVMRSNGVAVVAAVDNGADAIGVAIAEQPDLVLVEDTLAMVPGETVIREVREFCPATVVAAQVAYGDRVAPLLEAGADAVFTRSVPPSDVAQELLERLQRSTGPGVAQGGARESCGQP